MQNFEMILDSRLFSRQGCSCQSFSIDLVAKVKIPQLTRRFTPGTRATERASKNLAMKDAWKRAMDTNVPASNTRNA